MENKEFTINVCSFMGRESNIKILHQYIEEGLRIGSIDKYYMIDMTRNKSDHNFIWSECQRLNKTYPDRVFVSNREERGKQIQDGTVMDSVGYWAPFYKFMGTFKDNDVIIKLDDDTLFLDVETLRSAAQLRWENKDPIIMHSNCINNGMTAFHQAKKGMWNFPDKEIEMYPPCGLTGPLFAHPKIACKCHKQFISDLIRNPNSLESYKLKENIYFNARVSINCIFMLGSDRKHFINIDAQDEYITSSKLGQELDRPNMIIGDFITAHHTYGVQEPVMEDEGTFELYENLAKNWFKNDVERINKEITNSFGSATPIKFNNAYINRSWVDENSFVIQNARSKKYMTLTYDVQERKDPKTKKGNGVLFLRTVLSGSDNDKYAFNMDSNIYTCTELLKTTNPNKENPQFMAFYVSRFFQQNYTKNGVKLHEQQDGTCLIESKSDPGMFLFSKEDDDAGQVLYFFRKKEDGFEPDSWNFISMKDRANEIFISNIIRKDLGKYENDPTYAEAVCDKDFPKMITPRGFYWTVRGHLWEFIQLDNGNYHIKCIDDERKSVWLSNLGSIAKTTDTPRNQWKLHKAGGKHKIQEVSSGLFLKVHDSGALVLDGGATLFTLSL
jgi:hypothetical protein